ncbi:Hypothetical protein, putative [Bodo saltans]|uniref:Leucine-rich repeat protein n=1 Tax=Bodo saltans TaxID=75058 RepID=A0A0S4ISX0_BODSA|nr:Hypothetical protein, putative [Bodo saltans]|eukprot:CUG06234.1 Hypothetical protein, putative [Bodo saltans]
MMAQARSIAVSLSDKRKNEDGSNGANALVMNAGTENDTVAAGVSSSILEEYIGCCASMGLRPSSVVLRMVLEHQAAPQRLTTLQLHHTYMGDSGTAALGRCLATTLPFLRALSLANNGVGNDGVAALSAGISEKARLPAVHAGQVLPLLVLDLSHNSKITRAGGQALLNTASRISSRLSLISLVGTRVTDYFESRIIRHCANTFDALSENDQQLVYDLGRELGLIADDDAAQMATGAGSRSDSVAR